MLQAMLHGMPQGSSLWAVLQYSILQCFLIESGAGFGCGVGSSAIWRDG